MTSGSKESAVEVGKGRRLPMYSDDSFFTLLEEVRTVADNKNRLKDILRASTDGLSKEGMEKAAAVLGADLPKELRPRANRVNAINAKIARL